MKLSRRDLGAAEARHRQSLFLSLAILLLVLIPVNAYIVARDDLWLALVNIVWAAALVVASVLTRRHGSPIADILDFALTAISSVSIVTLVALSGARQSPLLPWCLVMPVAVSLVARRSIRDSILSSSICGISTLFFVRYGHADTRTMAAWALLIFSSAFVSIASSVVQVRVCKTLGSLGTSRHRLSRVRAQSERERMEARRLALVGQLAGAVAHEVNNPLAIVKANLGFVRNELGNRLQPQWAESVAESIEEAAAGVERIRLLVRDLTDLAPHERVAGEECEPGDLVQDAVDLVASETGLTIVSEILAGLPALHVVRHHVVQTLASVLQNAVDAVERLPAGSVGTVTIRTSREPLGVRFEIEDTGTGLSDDVLPRLFEPFFTTKPFGSGRGLNLAKAKERVGRSGGSIAVTNRLEGGARVVVQFPLPPPIAEPLTKPAPAWSSC